MDAAVVVSLISSDMEDEGKYAGLRRKYISQLNGQVDDFLGLA